MRGKCSGFPRRAKDHHEYLRHRVAVCCPGRRGRT
jgi:hypothetical protein